jgi:hypothetical protein
MRLVVAVVGTSWLKLLLLYSPTFGSNSSVTKPTFCAAFSWTTLTTTTSSSISPRIIMIARFGWLQDYFEPPKKSSSSSSSPQSRQVQYPEQYPATYECNKDVVAEDNDDSDDDAEIKLLVRPLLKNTQLQNRPLQLVYNAEHHGWNAAAFHQRVDGKGAAIVLAKTAPSSANGGGNILVGGYNPKGWASLGGARPSVAAFVFYERPDSGGGGGSRFQKLQKVGGGGLACARDDFNFGISFGPDALVIGLQPNRAKLAQSKLGTYYERGPDDLSSLFDYHGASAELVDLKVLVGRYAKGEDIPYSGGVLDMTSG